MLLQFPQVSQIFIIQMDMMAEKKKTKRNWSYEFFWQLTREPRPFPTLKIKRNVEDIDSFKFEDFEVIGYDPHPTIKMKMAV